MRRPASLRLVVLGVLVPVAILAALGGWMRHPALVAAGLCVAVLVGLALSKSLLDALDDAVRTARQLATGQFEARMHGSRVAEWGLLSGALHDIGAASDQRDAQLNAALEDAASQRDLFYSIINASNDGLLLYDNDRRLLAANRRCADLLGFSMQDLLNRDTHDLMQALEERCVEPETYHVRLASHFAVPDQPHEDHLLLRAPRRRVLRRHSSPIVNGRGVQGRVFTYTDVTAETDVDRLKSEFVSMASHELRTPLTSVHGALQLALSGSGRLLDPEDRELLEISQANTERLVRLVNDLLDLSKIESGRMPFVVAPVSVAALVEDAARGMQGLASTRGTRITCTVAEGLPDLVGDRDHLMRVVANLLSNAVKYSPPGSVVAITAAMTPEGVEIAVEDEGPGIAPDQLDRLFLPFSRVGAHERQTTGGTGLGLAISRAIIEQHGGRIRVEPRDPTGCRFAFLLAQPDEPTPSLEFREDVA